MYDDNVGKHYLNIFFGEDEIKNDALSVLQGGADSSEVCANLYYVLENGKTSLMNLTG